MERKKINWGNPIKNKHYVVVSELPEEERIEFEKWLSCKKRPIIFKENDAMIDCAYYWDYNEYKQQC